jgi:two-component system, LytTR family, response regulator
VTHIRTVIVDDEPLTRERVRALAREIPDIDVIGEARNGLEALDLIVRTVPDLILIDVEMPELDGFGVIAALDTEHVSVVVFITAFEHYAVKAFDVGAIDYLHKPITRARFGAAILRARERLEHLSMIERRSVIDGAESIERARGYRSRYVVRRGCTHYFVPVQDIDWIDAADNYLNLHVAGRAHLARSTMKQAQDELDPKHFIRIHRSAIVAIDRVAAVTSAENGGFRISMRDGGVLRGSRQYADRVRALLAGSG